MLLPWGKFLDALALGHLEDNARGNLEAIAKGNLGVLPGPRRTYYIRKAHLTGRWSGA